MAVETSVETYLFTCARCAARWTESYQVSQVIDDAGDVRSFYRHGGVPVEAPVSGNVECPGCHATQARRDPLYGQRPDFDPRDFGLLAVPPPRSGEADAPLPPRHAATGSWRRYKFSAVVTLEAAGQARRQYLSGAPGLMVRAPSCDRPTQQHFFPAVVYTDDDRPLRPGVRGVVVTISVPDDDASECFQPGQHFTLWDGADIGHGTVAQRLFFQYQ
ncbi:MAG TPA: hypothetical protein VHV09_25740 [Trebonia sp.]|nr:hypothetical protein [Trebonia sp.]